MNRKLLQKNKTLLRPKKSKEIKQAPESKRKLNGGEKESSRVQAINFHQDGIKGEKAAVNKAIQLLKELVKKHPNDQEIKAYLGSATALLGRDATSVTDKMKYALEGLKLLDSVIEKNSSLIVARFLRGNVSYRLPELYFQRTSTAIEDFSFLVAAYEKDETVLSDAEYEEVLKNLIESMKRLNQQEKISPIVEKLKTLKGNGKPAGLNEPIVQNDEAVSSDLAGEGMTEEAWKMYEKALCGGGAQVKQANEFFDTFVLTNTAPEVQMYALDVQSMKGRDSLNTYEMFGAAIKAMKAMDELILNNPTSCELRLIRARHSLRLPEIFFRRAATALKDFEFVMDQVKSKKYSIEKEEYHQLRYDLGIAYEKLDMVKDALKTWEAILREKPRSALRGQIKEKLKILSYQKETRTLLTAKQDQYYKVAKEIHKMGALGNKDAAEKSLVLWEKAVEDFPECEVANSYYAASLALKGKYASEPQEMFKETIQALKLLKESIKSDNTELLFLRGMIYDALPGGFFYTTDKAIKDLQVVQSSYETNVERSGITKDDYLQLLYHLGLLYQKMSLLDQANKTWQKLIEEDTDLQYQNMLARQGVEIK